jgi:DNA-binding NarL/FixJ family response regulator
MVDIDKPDNEKIAKIANQRANQQVASVKWNLNILILAYSILTIVILLRLEGVAMEIVSSIAIVGLFAVWCTVRIREKKIYNDLFNEELNKLTELYERNKLEVLTSSVLSQRELEIISYAANGYTNKEIAVKLKISINTVKNHFSFVIRKLNVRDRTQVILLSINKGWVSSQFGLLSLSN